MVVSSSIFYGRFLADLSLRLRFKYHEYAISFGVSIDNFGIHLSCVMRLCDWYRLLACDPLQAPGSLFPHPLCIVHRKEKRDVLVVVNAVRSTWLMDFIPIRLPKGKSLCSRYI